MFVRWRRLSARGMGNTPRGCLAGHDDLPSSERVVPAGDGAVLAEDEVAASAVAAYAAVTSRPAHRHPITRMPTLDTVANGIDMAGDFMTRRDRRPYAWPVAVDEQRIGVADAACLHGDPHVAGSRFCESPIDYIELSSR
ncbi:MAG: hypothetical protein QOH54_2843 [Mycobacterium sp.]|jgi:hypothetical protein|nr:hypothetical protein [Mycobacterium sp.]MDT5363889.1 hypothetical protein [Mycobacterium sp.]